MKPMALLLVLSAFAGCSGSSPEVPPEGPVARGAEARPTAANFKQAMQAYFSAEHACIGLEVEFPAQFTETGRAAFRRRSKYLDEFVAIGFLRVEDTQQKIHVVPLDGPRRTELIPSVTYSLTPKGRTAATDWITEVGSTGTRFCYGSYRVLEITGSTKPRPLLVFPTTSVNAQVTVNYTYEADGIAEWATGSQILQDHFTVLARDLASESAPIEGTAELVLTPKGWMHRKLGAPVWGSRANPWYAEK
jgi:hypothetical protein